MYKPTVQAKASVPAIEDAPFKTSLCNGPFKIQNAVQSLRVSWHLAHCKNNNNTHNMAQDGVYFFGLENTRP